MVNYTWTISSMYTLPKVDDFSDVVVIADWMLTGQEGTYLNSIKNSTQFSLPQGSDFTPYADLTEQQVIGWVQTTIGAKAIEQYEAQIARNIYFESHPPITAKEQKLPWA